MSLDSYWTYCCKDSSVTYEIADTLNRYLDPAAQRHYRFNHDLLNPILYMELRGIRYDSPEAAKRLEAVNSHIWNLQQELDKLAGQGLKPDATKDEVFEVIADVMCYKRDRYKPKKDYINDYPRAMALANSWPISQQELGELNVLLGLSLNTKSAKLKEYLYDTLQLPKQYKKDKDGKEHLSTDYEALLRLSKLRPHPAITLAIQIGLVRTRSQMLAIHPDSDGRIRCGYNIVGTETGRLTCYTSPTGSGYNLQTIPKEDHLKPDGHPLRHGMRDLFMADEGYYLFECDLSGADGQSVAAALASCGDSTMLEDLRAGIKVAKVLCYLLRHGAGSLARKTREEIKDLTKEVSKDSWDYFACKIGQHMTSYRGGPRKMASVILMESEGKLVMTEAECRDLQNLFLIRYRMRLWWDRVERDLNRQPYPPKMTDASGHVRRFFGRKEDRITQALAHIPQANTTYATNLAVHNLWTDPENRVADRLRIEPLHQVHDAILGQFRIEDTSWAITKIRSYFDNTLIIDGIPIKIPFEGSYGTNWSFDEKSKVGEI